MTEIVIINSLLLIMVILAFAIIFTEELLTAVILIGFLSLLTACVFLAMHAVDVSLTEAAVGAGISTILYVATLSRTDSTTRVYFSYRIPAITVCLLLICLLVMVVLQLPALGDGNSPVMTYLAPRYLHESIHEIGVPNFVTSILASYRGFDTLGEVTVIFTALIGVLLLLAKEKNEDKVKD